MKQIVLEATMIVEMQEGSNKEKEKKIKNFKNVE